MVTILPLLFIEYIHMFSPDQSNTNRCLKQRVVAPLKKNDIFPLLCDKCLYFYAAQSQLPQTDFSGGGVDVNDV